MRDKFVAVIAVLFLLTACTSASDTYVVKIANYVRGNVTIDTITERQPLILFGNATVYNDVTVPLVASKVGLTTPIFDETHYSYLFEDAAAPAQEEYLFAAVQLPHSYKEGTNLDCHLHVSPIDNSTGNATFELSYRWTNVNAYEQNATEINATVQFRGEIDRHKILDFPSINGSGKTISSIVEARIKRRSSLSSDNYAANVEVMSFDCHHQMDTLGSASPYGKWS